MLRPGMLSDGPGAVMYWLNSRAIFFPSRFLASSFLAPHVSEGPATTPERAPVRALRDFPVRPAAGACEGTASGPARENVRLPVRCRAMPRLIREAGEILVVARASRGISRGTVSSIRAIDRSQFRGDSLGMLPPSETVALTWLQWSLLGGGILLCIFLGSIVVVRCWPRRRPPSRNWKRYPPRDSRYL